MLAYTLKNKRINDSWYCKEGDTYHAFFLEYGYDEPQKFQWTHQSCGHMTSRDLVNWEYEGTILGPTENTWSDRGIATGSIAKYNGKWYLIFTGGDLYSNSNIGFGLMVSRDLSNWEVISKEPFIRAATPLASPVMRDGEPTLSADTIYRFQYLDKHLNAHPIADPYIYPEAINGKYYIFVNSHIADAPKNHRGAVAIFETENFCDFKPYKIAAIDTCDRMETCQIWEHDGKWYMYSGCVYSTLDENNRITGQKNENWLFVSDSFDGPYSRRQLLQFPVHEQYPGTLYIAKVIKDLNGDDVMMINNIPYGAIGPYRIAYNQDNTITLEM